MSGAIAIILGRHGSRGLPGKNVADIAGKPCIAWTIEHARASTHITHTIVSTDPGPIEDIASAMGISVIERPHHLADDIATIDAAARHALNAASDDPELADILNIVLLYANVPVRPHNLTDRAAETLLRTGCDSVQSYCPVGKHHPWWTVVVEPDNHQRVHPFDEGELFHGVHRRQDLPPAHVPDGGVIALTRQSLMLERTNPENTSPHAFLGRDRRGILTNHGEVIDIDDEIDRHVAEAVLMRTAQGVRP